MKKPYQIETQRAVMQLEAMAADGDQAVFAADGFVDAGRSPGTGWRAQPAPGGRGWPIGGVARGATAW